MALLTAEPTMNAKPLSPRKLAAWVGAFLGALVLVIAGLLLIFGGAIINNYGKSKAERAFARAHPGWVLQIGQLAYGVWANRLVARSVTVSGSNTTLKVGRISLTGAHWAMFFWGKASLAELLAQASMDATSIDAEFPHANYRILCARLGASAPASELTFEGTELRTSLGDQAFFAARNFRATRFHVIVPECKVSGLAYGELLRGKGYRARSIQLTGPSLEALINRDKPLEPLEKSPLMVHEALAAIPVPLQIDNVSLTNGSLRYCEQLAAGSPPGVLKISAVNLSAEGIANRGPASAAIQLRGQGELMDDALLKVQMSIPIAPPNFSLHYSGSLSKMDLTRLDPFLDIAEHTQIKSGTAQEAAFEIDVTAGQARGKVLGVYGNLEIALLDKEAGPKERLENRVASSLDNHVASFLANALKIRSSNAPDASGSMRQGEVNYVRKPGDEFQQFAWFALRSGVLDIISR